MNMLDKEIEQVIKQKLSNINPPRSAFDQVMENVTREAEARYTEGKDKAVLSPYQSVPQIFMKKLILIGTPVFALALVAVISAKNVVWPVPISDPVSVDGNIADTNSEVVTNSNPDTSSGRTSTEASASAEKTIDDVFAAIMTDIEADNASLAAEEDDATIINTELQNYNNIKNSNYDDLI